MLQISLPLILLLNILSTYLFLMGMFRPLPEYTFIKKQTVLKTDRLGWSFREKDYLQMLKKYDFGHGVDIEDIRNNFRRKDLEKKYFENNINFKDGRNNINDMKYDDIHHGSRSKYEPKKKDPYHFTTSIDPIPDYTRAIVLLLDGLSHNSLVELPTFLPYYNQMTISYLNCLLDQMRINMLYGLFEQYFRYKIKKDHNSSSGSKGKDLRNSHQKIDGPNGNSFRGEYMGHTSISDYKGDSSNTSCKSNSFNIDYKDNVLAHNRTLNTSNHNRTLNATRNNQKDGIYKLKQKRNTNIFNHENVAITNNNSYTTLNDWLFNLLLQQIVETMKDSIAKTLAPTSLSGMWQYRAAELKASSYGGSLCINYIYTTSHEKNITPNPHIPHLIPPMDNINFLSLAGLPTSTTTRCEAMITGRPTNYRNGLTTFQHLNVQSHLFSHLPVECLSFYGDHMWGELLPAYSRYCPLVSYSSDDGLRMERKVVKQLIQDYNEIKLRNNKVPKNIDYEEIDTNKVNGSWKINSLNKVIDSRVTNSLNQENASKNNEAHCPNTGIGSNTSKVNGSKEIEKSAQTRTIQFCHLIALDHLGHTHKSIYHPAISHCLSFYRQTIQTLLRELDDETILLVCSDHGVERNGGHGGGRRRQLESVGWVFGEHLGVIERDNRYKGSSTNKFYAEENKTNRIEINRPNKSELNTLNKSELNGDKMFELFGRISELNTLNKSEINTSNKSELNTLNKSELNGYKMSELNTTNRSELNTANKSELNNPPDADLSISLPHSIIHLINYQYLSHTFPQFITDPTVYREFLEENGIMCTSRVLKRNNPMYRKKTNNMHGYMEGEWYESMDYGENSSKANVSSKNVTKGNSSKQTGSINNQNIPFGTESIRITSQYNLLPTVLLLLGYPLPLHTHFSPLFMNESMIRESLYRKCIEIIEFQVRRGSRSNQDLKIKVNSTRRNHHMVTDDNTRSNSYSTNEATRHTSDVYYCKVFHQLWFDLYNLDLFLHSLSISTLLYLDHVLSKELEEYWTGRKAKWIFLGLMGLAISIIWQVGRIGWKKECGRKRKHIYAKGLSPNQQIHAKDHHYSDSPMYQMKEPLQFIGLNSTRFKYSEPSQSMRTKQLQPTGFEAVQINEIEPNQSGHLDPLHHSESKQEIATFSNSICFNAIAATVSGKDNLIDVNTSVKKGDSRDTCNKSNIQVHLRSVHTYFMNPNAIHFLGQLLLTTLPSLFKQLFIYEDVLICMGYVAVYGMSTYYNSNELKQTGSNNPDKDHLKNSREKRSNDFKANSSHKLEPGCLNKSKDGGSNSVRPVSSNNKHTKSECTNFSRSMRCVVNRVTHTISLFIRPFTSLSQSICRYHIHFFVAHFRFIIFILSYYNIAVEPIQRERMGVVGIIGSFLRWLWSILKYFEHVVKYIRSSCIGSGIDWDSYIFNTISYFHIRIMCILETNLFVILSRSLKRSVHFVEWLFDEKRREVVWVYWLVESVYEYFKKIDGRCKLEQYGNEFKSIIRNGFSTGGCVDVDVGTKTCNTNQCRYTIVKTNTSNMDTDISTRTIAMHTTFGKKEVHPLIGLPSHLLNNLLSIQFLFHPILLPSLLSIDHRYLKYFIYRREETIFWMMGQRRAVLRESRTLLNVDDSVKYCVCGSVMSDLSAIDSNITDSCKDNENGPTKWETELGIANPSKFTKKNFSENEPLPSDSIECGETKTKSQDLINLDRPHYSHRLCYALFLSLLHQPTFITHRTHDLTTIDYMTCFKISSSLNLNSLVSVGLYFFFTRIKGGAMEYGHKYRKSNGYPHEEFWLTDIYLLFWSCSMFLVTFFTYRNYSEGNEYFFGRFFNLGMYWCVDNIVGIAMWLIGNIRVYFKKNMYKGEQSRKGCIL